MKKGNASRSRHYELTIVYTIDAGPRTEAICTVNRFVRAIPIATARNNNIIRSPIVVVIVDNRERYDAYTLASCKTS